MKAVRDVNVKYTHLDQFQNFLSKDITPRDFRLSSRTIGKPSLIRSVRERETTRYMFVVQIGSEVYSIVTYCASVVVTKNKKTKKQIRPN